MPLSHPLIDAALSASRINNQENSMFDAPPTLVVSELISLMVKKGGEAYQNPELSDDMIQRLQRCYYNYASHCVEGEGDSKVMNKTDVEKWLTDINLKVGRGSEFRTAAKQMGWMEPETEKSDESRDGEVKKPDIFLPDDGILTLDGFLNVYRGELIGGKFWGINYDLAVMGEMLPSIGVFKARFDRIYCSKSIALAYVLDTVTSSPCPNEFEPSDHLPVAASFMSVELN